MKNETGSETIGKISSGIEGFDEISSGGLPEKRTTLLMGGPGCGKTVFALHVVVSGAAKHGNPGIFVAFEENARRVSANAKTFGWDMGELERKHLFFLDARMRSDVVKSGPFDLTALLSSIEAKARKMGATLIVFDAIDVLLSLLDDPAAESRELHRLHEWLNENEFTGIITTKIEDDKPATAQRYGFMPFMADCAVLMSQRVENRVTMRAMRIVKYRGSSHVLNEVPFVIGSGGLEVGSVNGKHPEPQPFDERVSTGIDRLDGMLHGGLYRGTNALVTGSSGTGKTMLAGSFIDAACRRNERALFISFDENSRDIIRDVVSIGIDLEPHIARGLLCMEALRSETASSEEHFTRIKNLITQQKPSCVAIDSISAFERAGSGLAARTVAERLIYLCRNAGITMLFTSLMEGTDSSLETTALHVSTITDSWIQITYALRNGERNRSLSVIKSRGSNHSNLMRELIFTSKGVTLADPYTAGGEVLMGTMRTEKETALHLEMSLKHGEVDQKRRDVQMAINERDHSIVAANRDLQKHSDQLTTMISTDSRRSDEAERAQSDRVQGVRSKIPSQHVAGPSARERIPAAAGAKKRGKSV